MQFHLSDVFTAANLLVLLALYRKVNIVFYQHKLMWADFASARESVLGQTASPPAPTEKNWVIA